MLFLCVFSRRHSISTFPHLIFPGLLVYSKQDVTNTTFNFQHGTDSAIGTQHQCHSTVEPTTVDWCKQDKVGFWAEVCRPYQKNVKHPNSTHTMNQYLHEAVSPTIQYIFNLKSSKIVIRWISISNLKISGVCCLPRRDIIRCGSWFQGDSWW